MIVNSTELQNNFGKYLVLANQEEVIVTRNGNPIAKLVPVTYGKMLSERWPSSEIIMESTAKYNDSLGKSTYEEFLELTKDNELRYEYIDGQIYMLASPKTEHQSALTELFGNFYNFFQGKPCRPFVAPYDIVLRTSSNQINSVQPDLAVICDLEQHLGEDGFYKGVPALVIEILSESTRRKDLVSKLNLYMEAGVKEYWIVNPLNKEITVYLFEDLNIKDSTTYKNGESALSFSFLGLSVPLNVVFARPY
ncbi:type II toxin-antitoxin system prevent-host-death family antitoxin [Cohnella soli]|uniref:Type II toxin-antitoxin system prevent-host-death family antitoxin n=1 Tax=Cohnella soli TaxID=425005 RepID=A0ABW0HZ28_9BACL